MNVYKGLCVQGWVCIGYSTCHLLGLNHWSHPAGVHSAPPPDESSHHKHGRILAVTGEHTT